MGKYRGSRPCESYEKLYNERSRLTKEEQNSTFQTELANLDNFAHTLFSVDIGSNNTWEYIILSAWVARYHWMKDEASIQLPSWIGIGEENNQLLHDIILEKTRLPKDLDGSLQLREDLLLDYLKQLPYPLNVKCLAEALISNTNWNRFFASTLQAENGDLIGPEGAKDLMDSRILEMLMQCNRDAFKKGKLNDIASEIAVILGHPHFKPHLSNILQLFREKKLSSQSRAWARKGWTKQVVLDFIDTIMDEETKGRYQTKRLAGPLAEFFSTKTRCEQLTAGMFGWMSSSENKYKVVPYPFEDIQKSSALLPRK